MAHTLITAAPNPRALSPSIAVTSIISAETSVAAVTTSTISAVDRNAPEALLTTTLIITALTSKDVDSVPTCPHCICTFLSHISLSEEEESSTGTIRLLS
nr:unnamed protein product [Spirometra erinaceieuropaei]